MYYLVTREQTDVLFNYTSTTICTSNIARNIKDFESAYTPVWFLILFEIVFALFLLVHKSITDSIRLLFHLS